jgi:hypothetical protein
MKKLLFLLPVFLMISCSKENKTHKIGERFFEIYSQRNDIQKMVSFYSADFQYENVNFHSEANDAKFLYESFYNWSDPNFKFSGKETIKLENLLTNDSTIIAKGVTMPYDYNGKHVEGTRFVIWLELDKDLKIKKQTDWFDYPMEEMIEAYQIKRNLEIE